MPCVLCFGELLWDELPGGPRLGGAPANVAYHLAQFGLAARLVSAVGEDAAGARALAQLAAAGVDVSLVARQALLPTGRVSVQLTDEGPRYRIAEGVAWDAIPGGPPLSAAAATAQAVVFGTLAQRSAANQAALADLLEAAGKALIVCDLNFRPPFVTKATVSESLRRAAVLKLNEEELAALPALLGMPAGESFPRSLCEHYGLRRLYLTRGKAGCRAIDAAGVLDAPAPTVTVADSVGAGDAFTAAMVFGELQGWPPARSAATACRVGAFVAGQPGAMPAWPPTLRTRLLSE